MQSTRFGRIRSPDEAWLAKQPPEPILEPELPIIDTHHNVVAAGASAEEKLALFSGTATRAYRRH